MMTDTLISLEITAVPLCNACTRKVSAQNDDLGHEAAFQAVVQDPPKT
jgi:hypothetical protein